MSRNHTPAYFDADVAYLAGMIVARGTLTDGDHSKQLVIEFPFKSLEAHGITKKYSQSDAVELSVHRIKQRISKLLGTSLEAVISDSSCSLVAKYANDTMEWRNLRALFGDKLSYRSMRIPALVMSSPDSTIAIEFIRGFADVAGFIRQSNNYYDGKNRVYLEVNNKNWIVPLQLCALLQGRLSASVQMIQWGHPNTRTPNDPTNKSWAKEHQVKVFAAEFLKVGFYAPHKQEILEELANSIDQRQNINMCNPYCKRKPRLKPDHPGENDARLPSALKGKHHDSYWEICLALGCSQFKATTGRTRSLQSKI